MKKLIILLMAAALGATTLSCNDQDFSDVENTVLKETTYDIDGDKGDIKDGPW